MTAYNVNSSAASVTDALRDILLIHPERVAVECAHEVLTYADVRRRSSAIAMVLAERGALPGTHVGVCCERSFGLVAGLVAVLAAGSAYVPLDVAHPIRRLRHIIEDAEVTLVVVDEAGERCVGDALRLQPPRVDGPRLVRVTSAGAVLAPLPEMTTDVQISTTAALWSSPARGQRAYVMYTSGSTGVPKGVAVSHGALWNTVRHFAAVLGLGRVSTWLAVTTVCFDISALEIFVPLCWGQRLLLARAHEARSGPALLRMLARALDGGGILPANRHTVVRSSAQQSLPDDKRTLTCLELQCVLQATPATFRLLLQAGWRGSRSLVALCGGEPLPPEFVQLASRCGAFYNVYGPTEATIWCTVHRVCWQPPAPAEDSDPELLKRTVSEEARVVGRPISAMFAAVRGAGIRSDVCDQDWQPCGQAGELWIGGCGLAEGYVGKESLTNERFVEVRPPDHLKRTGDASDRQDLENAKHVRMYRTGDRAWIMDGGEICLLGRLPGTEQDQVKVRGHRVELGEVEAALSSHPAVLSAAASTTKAHDLDGTTELRLLAFVVLHGNESATDRHDPNILSPDSDLEQWLESQVAGIRVTDEETPSASDNASERNDGITGAQPRELRVEMLRSILEHARAWLPMYMIPSAVYEIGALPVTDAGKLDRSQLAAMDMSVLHRDVRIRGGVSAMPNGHNRAQGELSARGGESHVEHVVTDVVMRAAVEAILGNASDVSAAHVEWTSPDRPFAEMGIDSMAVVPFLRAVHTLLVDLAENSTDVPRLAIELPPTAPLEHPTPRKLAGHILRIAAQSAGHANLCSIDASPRGERTGVQKAWGRASSHRRAKLVAQRQHSPENLAPKLGCSPNTVALEPVLDACRRGDASAVEEAIKNGWSVSTRDRFGGPGMHWAASGGNLTVCKLLVAHGADAAAADTKSGRTALHWAARQGHAHIALWLLEEHSLAVDKATKDGTTPFQLAAWGGHVDVCKLLLARGAHLKHLNRWTCSAVHFAALAGQHRMCEWLHAKGVSMAATNAQGHNALHKAAYGGHVELCLWLQEGPPRLDPTCTIVDVRGQTAAHLARKAGFYHLASVLLTCTVTGPSD